MTGQSGWPLMGVRPGARDEAVMRLAQAVFATPDAAKLASSAQIMLGSAVAG